jgi:ABC-2 type transport system permease protein
VATSSTPAIDLSRRGNQTEAPAVNDAPEGRLSHAAYLLRVFLTLVRLRYRTRLMYPAGYVSFLLAKLVGYVGEYAVLWLLLTRFKNIAGWTLPEVLLLHSLNVVSYTVAASFVFHIARNIESYIVTGQLDAVLLKPVHPLLWLSGFFYSPTYISQTILGMGVVLWSAAQLRVAWTPAAIAALLVMLLGASLLQAALFLVSSSVTFWTTRGRNIASAILSLRGLVDFPVSIYGPGIRLLLTFVVPVAFINYYPAGLLLDL